jgi:hypothetical protein
MYVYGLPDSLLIYEILVISQLPLPFRASERPDQQIAPDVSPHVPNIGCDRSQEVKIPQSSSVLYPARYEYVHGSTDSETVVEGTRAGFQDCEDEQIHIPGVRLPRVILLCRLDHSCLQAELGNTNIRRSDSTRIYSRQPAERSHCE